VEISDEELAAREPAAAMTAALARPSRGWEQLYVRTVRGADTGADLDFLVGSSGDEVSRDSH
jgi:dihydroxy-acid dehydratase